MVILHIEIVITPQQALVPNFEGLRGPNTCDPCQDYLLAVLCLSSVERARTLTHDQTRETSSIDARAKVLMHVSSL